MKQSYISRIVPFAISAIASIALALPHLVLAQSTAMAPPVSTDPSAAASSGVYNWQDVPVGQKVTIVRAVFDQGGYQLYDDKGDTIVIPFVDDNLYVMRFARSKTRTYFVNDNGVPTFHLPPGAYLSNSAADGARWYPFDKAYTYSGPVYIGPAPTWDAYINMGWYPGMVYRGGYWATSPWHAGVTFSPMPGLFINIGGTHYTGWGNYVSYYNAHPANRVYMHNVVAFKHYGVHQHGPQNFGHYHHVPGNRAPGVGHGPAVVHPAMPMGRGAVHPVRDAPHPQPAHDHPGGGGGGAHPSGGHDHR